jgi:hypothetical protein
MFSVIRFHVCDKLSQLRIVICGEGFNQHLGGFTRIRATHDVGRAVFVVGQQFGAVRQIKRADRVNSTSACLAAILASISASLSR